VSEPGRRPRAPERGPGRQKAPRAAALRRATRWLPSGPRFHHFCGKFAALGARGATNAPEESHCVFFSDVRTGGGAPSGVVALDPRRHPQDPLPEAAAERRKNMPRHPPAPQLPRRRRRRAPGGGGQGVRRPQGLQQGTELVQGPRAASRTARSGSKRVRI
jgi:hypothetical protein